MSRAEFYRLVSAAIRCVKDVGYAGDLDAYLAGIENIARELEHTFAAHNIKFDAVRFRRDCGLE